MPHNQANSATIKQKAFRLPTWLNPGNAGVFYAFGALVLVLSIATAIQGAPAYLSPNNVSNVLDQSALLGILAVTTTIVLISGNFDLSVGSVAALGAAICLLALPVVGFWPAFLLALVGGAVVGLFNGLVVQYIGINAFIVTLGSMTAVRGIVLLLTDGRTITAQPGAEHDALAAIDAGRFITPNLYLVAGIALLLIAALRFVLARRRSTRTLQISTIILAVAGAVLTAVSPVAIFTIEVTQRVIYMLAIVVIAALILRYTTVGRRLYATGGNPEAARLSGISVDRYRVVAFVLNGTAAAFVGVLYAARLNSINPTGLSGFELTALAAAILGGTALFGGLGNVVKSLFGVLILITLANGFNILNLGANYQGLIEGLVLIIAAGMYTVAQRRQQTMRIRTDAAPNTQPVSAADSAESTSPAQPVLSKTKESV